MPLLPRLFHNNNNNNTSTIFLTVSWCALCLSQSYILWILGREAAWKLLQLQLGPCLLSSSSTSHSFSFDTWTDDTLQRVVRHFVWDDWIHPLLYALALIVAGWYYDTKNGQQRPSNIVFIVALPVVGALLDGLENYYHKRVFEQLLVLRLGGRSDSDSSNNNQQQEQQDQCLWYACVFACTKWLVLAVCVVRIGYSMLGSFEKVAGPNNNATSSSRKRR